MNANLMPRAWIGLFLTALLAPPVLAGYDEKYPAADFKPSVIYRDPALTGAASHAEIQAPDPKYPAAHFVPIVLHPVKDAVVHAADHPIDPKYPAAYFTPSVIYPAK